MLFKALEYMIHKKISLFNNDNLKGYLICKNDYYIFQPFYKYENIVLNDIFIIVGNYTFNESNISIKWHNNETNNYLFKL